MSSRWKFLLSLALTAVILAVLYSMIDPQAMLETLRKGDPFWLGGYLLLFVPQLFLAGLRWQVLVRFFGRTEIPFGLAFGQTMGAYAANLVIPSKLGEFVKGVWLRIPQSKFLPYFLVVLEKVLDILATLGILTLALMTVIPDPRFQSRAVLVPILLTLLVCWIAGLLLLRGPWPVRIVNRYLLKGDEAAAQAQWKAVVGERGKLARVVGMSLLLWTLQLLQFDCMFRIFGVHVPLTELFTGAPLALLAGAMPLTAGGVGLRDAALLWYFGTSITMETVLAVGILSFLRILLVGLVGVPFFFLRMKEVGNGR